MHALLVMAQFALAAALVLTARWWPLSEPRIGLPILFSCLGAALAVWAWRSMGLTHIRVTPAPGDRAVLVTDGPYRWIRHPMYSGLLLFTLPLLASPFAWWRIALWMLLVAVLEGKASEEERLLGEKFPAYVAYRDRTWRFLPGLR